MLRLNKNISSICPHFFQLVRTVNLKYNEDCIFKNDYTIDQYDKIMRTFNNSQLKDFVRYKIPDPNIKEILNWRSDNGSFKSITNVLDSGIITEEQLKQMCNSIVDDGLKKKSKKQIKAFVTPDIPQYVLQILKAAVAIHIDPVGMSWAKLEKQGNNVTNWSCEGFSALPKKMLPTDTFELALNILKKIPPGDVYVFESSHMPSPQNQSKHSAVATYNQQMELLSMLLVLLNTSHTHNNGLSQHSDKQIENKVFYLKANVPARLFKTLLGSEKISAVSIIEDFINGQTNFGLTYCTPLKLGEDLKHMFNNQSPSNKDLLCRAVILGSAFMDLCVYKNIDSIEALSSRRKDKETLSISGLLR